MTIIHDNTYYPSKKQQQKTNKNCLRLSDRQTRLQHSVPPNAITFLPTTHRQTAAALSAIPTTICIISLKSAKKRHYLWIQPVWSMYVTAASPAEDVDQYRSVRMWIIQPGAVNGQVSSVLSQCSLWIQPLWTAQSETERGPERSCRISAQGS